MRSATPTDRLARAFVVALSTALTPEQMAEVRRLSNSEKYADACPSHDYCDANEVMDSAFRTVMGREPDTDGEMTDDDATLWNQAWDRAREWGYEAPTTPDTSIAVILGQGIGLSTLATLPAGLTILRAEVVHGVCKNAVTATLEHAPTERDTLRAALKAWVPADCTVTVAPLSWSVPFQPAEASHA